MSWYVWLVIGWSLGVWTTNVYLWLSGRSR